AGGLRGERRGVGVEGVDIAVGDGAGLGVGGGVLADGVVGDLGDGAGLRGAGDDRGVVGAGDGEGDGLQGGAAVAVVDGDVVLLGQDLTGLQEVERAVGNLEGPADRAA